MANSPDILWLSLESIRADHTPMYGYKRNTTPTLNKLAKENETTVLDNGIAQSLWTPASSASMLTGTHLSTHRVGQDGRAKEKLPQSIETIPELLRNVGYETALFSPNPYLSEATGLDRGFDHTTSVKAVPASYSPLNTDALDYWIEGVRRALRSRIYNIDRLKHELKTTENEVLERQTKRWLNSTAGNVDQFFAYVHIPSPHHPYLPNTDYLNAFADEIRFSPEEAYSLVKEIYYGGPTVIRNSIAKGLNFSKEEWEAIVAMYDATLRHMDSTVNSIISEARRTSDSLIVVVVGDHGELFGELDLLGHNLALHDKLIQVPMLIAGISDVITNKETMSQQIDLTRTIGEITGISTAQFEGRDLRTGDRPYAISQRGQAHLGGYTRHNDSFNTDLFFEAPYTVVTDGDYKLAINEERTDLYQLPDEQTDVSESETQHLKRLKSFLNDHTISWKSGEPRSAAEFNDSQLEQLRNLGYLS